VAKRRGFFAELNYQAQQAEKRRLQQEAAVVRARAAAVRSAEKARRAAERAHAAAARASEAQRKAAAKAAARLHVESRLAEVAELNAGLAATLAEIDGLLAATLVIDDFVDLEALKVTAVEHPGFDPGHLATPTPPLSELVYPPEPVFVAPPAPSGMSAVFGGKKKHQAALVEARAKHEEALEGWNEQNTRRYNDYVARQEEWKQAEARRMEKLAQAEASYREECRQREADAKARNEELSRLVNDLAFDVPAAIEEYVGIVLSNSVYPDAFPVSHDHEFDLASRELTLLVTVPEPSTVPSVKEYRYVRTKDEITSAALPLRAQKERYASAVWQVAVRTLHEVFEADRAGKIHSLALTVAVERTAPATGLLERAPLVEVAADRETFAKFDLANVVPEATLEHLGAAMSKSPFDLAPADTRTGVRVRNQV